MATGSNDRVDLESLPVGQETAAAARRFRELVTRALSADSSFGPLDAVAATDAADVAIFLHPLLQGENDLQLLAVGMGASPGAATGRVVTTVQSAFALAEQGEEVILVRPDTGPEDVTAMRVAAGVITARGGLASHAALVARGWGLPAVVGIDSMSVEPIGVVIGEHFLAQGDTVTIDGRSGEVFRGSTTVMSAGLPPALGTLLAWADTIRGNRVAIQANADDVLSAERARSFGAEGIALCRTEHMLLQPSALALVQELILTEDSPSYRRALAALEDIHTTALEGVLLAMQGLPVTIRLLDLPLHEFLPDIEQLVTKQAKGDLDDFGAAQLAALRDLHEVNPMLGTRGVRLGLLRPDLYEMQVRAIVRAMGGVRSRGVDPTVQLLVPLVVDATELHAIRACLSRLAVGTEGSAPPQIEEISMGSMIETPRAAVLAGDLASASDFLSFGTNDLTQMTFGLSRDDVERCLLPHYLDHGLLETNPFQVLDAAGVGQLLRLAIDRARGVKPTIPIGVCGEQVGNPDSVRYLVDLGVDYVSCSPYRLPLVRLWAAQALIDSGMARGELRE